MGFGVCGLGFRVYLGAFQDGPTDGPWHWKPLSMKQVSGFTRSVLGILFTFWVMGFLIYGQKGSFFLPRGTGIKFRV